MNLIRLTADTKEFNDLVNELKENTELFNPPKIILDIISGFLNSPDHFADFNVKLGAMTERTSNQIVTLKPSKSFLDFMIAFRAKDWDVLIIKYGNYIKG